MNTSRLRADPRAGDHPKWSNPPSLREVEAQIERVGHAVRAARGDESQQVVATRAGITDRTLRRVELGHVDTSLGTLVRIAAALGTSLDALLTDES